MAISILTWIFKAAVVLALLLYGATESQTCYRLWLLLVVPTLIACWTLTSGSLRQIHFLTLTLVGIFLLSRVAGEATLSGRGYLIVSLGWSALFLSLAVTAQSRRATLSLASFLIVLGSFEALYGLVQAVGGVDYIGGYYRAQERLATGTFVNRNHFAGFLNMTIPLAVGALVVASPLRKLKERLRSETYAWTWIMVLSCSFMTLAVFLSLSRAGTLTLVSCLIFIILMIRADRHTKSVSGGIGWLILFTTVGLTLWVGLDSMLSRSGMADAAAKERMSVYRDSLKLITDYPLRGVGPGMYQWRFRPYYKLDARTLYDYAHNDYLQSAAEWGVPLALLFWTIVLCSFYRCGRVFFQSDDRSQKGLALGCSAAILSILLHSLADFNLYIPANLMIFCVILGLSWNVERAWH